MSKPESSVCDCRQHLVYQCPHREIERLSRAVSEGNKRLVEEIDATLAARAQRDRLRAALERWIKAWEHGNPGERSYAYEKAVEAMRPAVEPSNK